MIDLLPEQIKIVKRILREYAPDIEVRAFGSRVNGKAEKYSDLDLVLMGKEKLDWRFIEALKDAFSESDLPFMVDVVDVRAVSESFCHIIEKNNIVIQKSTGVDN
ncbi:nucleotidyltransferase domain-containing protein [bacterium]|nr:nucleotidyltransferase domain-containing protein [FCB group bacterium]MBL7190679.1 nucleotidyltransferase domain-containing protein [bacterium]